MTTMINSRHLCPSLLAKPLSLIPASVHATVIAKAVNRLFAEQITDGELAFLNRHSVRIEVIDAGILFDLYFDGRRLLAASSGNSPDLIFRGHLFDFMLLASRQEDSDTLFFQRRLQIEGDTDIGLGIKNFLDAIEIESLPYHRLWDKLLGRVVQVYDRLS